MLSKMLFCFQVTKTVNAKALSREERHQLLNAISFKFITRLLKTGELDMTCIAIKIASYLLDYSVVLLRRG